MKYYTLFFKYCFWIYVMLSGKVVYGQALSDSLPLSAEVSAFIQKKSMDWQLALPKNPFHSVKSPINDLKNKKIFQHTKASLRLETFWNHGDSLLYGSVADAVMTYVAPDIQTDFLGIPIVVGGNLVFRDQQLEKQLSSFKIQFDYHRFLEQKKQVLRQQVLQQNLKQWTVAEKQNWENKLKWDTLYAIQGNPQFRQARAQLGQVVDSLEGLQANALLGRVIDSLKQLRSMSWQQVSDSTLGTMLDSAAYVAAKAQWSQAIDSLKRLEAYALSKKEEVMQRLLPLQAEYEKYKSIDKAYKQLLNNFAQNNETFKKITAAKEKMLAAEKEAEAMAEQLKHGDKWFGKEAKNWVHKSLSQVKALDLGTFDVLGSEFTLRNMTMNGGHIVFEQNKIYAEAAFGKQSTATPMYRMGFNPIYGAGEMNRHVLYLRSGLGHPDSAHFHGSVTRIMDNEPGASFWNPITRPKFNDLLAFSGQQPLTKNVDLNAEMAYSIYRTDVVQGWGIQQEIQPSTEVSPFRYTAFQLRVGSKEQPAVKGGWSLSYAHIGNQFITLGNPFLLNNRQLLKANIHKNFLDNQLQIKLGFDKQLSTGSTAISPAIDQTGWRVESTLKYGSNHRFSVQIMPRYYLLAATGSPKAVGRYDVYNFQNVLQGKNDAGRWLSMVNFTNMNMTIPMSDTVRFTGLKYVFAQNQWMPSEHWTFSWMNNIGLEGNWNALHVRDALVQGDVRWQQKKGQWMLGYQYLSTLVPRATVQSGVVFGCSWQLKQGTIGFQSQLRARLGVGESSTLFSGQSFWNIHF
jgi:hypothetical protein